MNQPISGVAQTRIWGLRAMMCRWVKGARVRNGVVILSSVFLLVGCGAGPAPNRSKFRIVHDHFAFASMMENGDTMNVRTDLSFCMSSGYDRIQITRSNDSLFFQLVERRIENTPPIHMSKVHYKFQNDTLAMEKLMSDLEVAEQGKGDTPFFVITSPKEQDTIKLSINGFTNTARLLERYENMLSEMYPQEMQALTGQGLTPSDSLKIEVMRFLPPSQ